MKRKNFPERYRALYNLTVEEAKSYIASNVLMGDQNARVKELRVTERDGEHLPCFMDWRIERLNVSISGGKIVGTSGVG